MYLSAFWEDKIRSNINRISRLLRNPYIQYLVHNCLPDTSHPHLQTFALRSIFYFSLSAWSNPSGACAWSKTFCEFTSLTFAIHTLPLSFTWLHHLITPGNEHIIWSSTLRNCLYHAALQLWRSSVMTTTKLKKKNIQNTSTSLSVRAKVYVLTHETRTQDILNWKQ